MTSRLAREIAELVKGKAQQRHGDGTYAVAGHKAETRLLASGRRAEPLHRAIAQHTEQQEDDTDA